MKPTYVQMTALGKLINGVSYGHPIAAQTMRILEREGWVQDGKVTELGTAAYRCAVAGFNREPRSIAPDAYTRTAVYFGERRDV